MRARRIFSDGALEKVPPSHPNRPICLPPLSFDPRKPVVGRTPLYKIIVHLMVSMIFCMYRQERLNSNYHLPILLPSEHLFVVYL